MGALTGIQVALLCMVLGSLDNASALTEITKTGCGTTKGCSSSPESCDSSKNCDYLLTYSKDGDNYVFELSSKTKWVAVGLNSKGGPMAGTDAVMCTTLSGGISIQHYQLTGQFLPAKTDPTPSQIVLNESRSDGGKTLCRFYRKIVGSGKLKSLDTSHCLVFAYGTVDAGIPQHHSWRKTTAEPVNLEKYTNLKVKEEDYSLIKAHGSLMTIAWMGFAAVAIFMARYMRLMWEDQTLFGQKVWFSVHRGLMTLVVLFSTIGIILVFVYRKGWSEGIGAHPYTGIITLALALTNPIIAQFRPHPGEPKRFIFNWAHRTVGLSALCLAVVTLFLAVFLPQLNIKDKGLPVLITFCVGIAIVLIFDIILCVRSNTVGNEPLNQKKGYVEQMEQEQPSHKPMGTWLYYLMFGFVILIAVATTIALVVTVATIGGDDKHEH